MDDGQQNNLNVQGGNPGMGETPFGATDFGGANFDTTQPINPDPTLQPVQSVGDANTFDLSGSSAPAEAPAPETPIDEEMSRKMDELLGNPASAPAAQPTPGVNPFLTNNQAPAQAVPQQMPMGQSAPVQPMAAQPMAAPMPQQMPVQQMPVQAPTQPMVQSIPTQPVAQPIPAQPVAQPMPAQPMTAPQQMAPMQPAANPAMPQQMQQPMAQSVPQQKKGGSKILIIVLIAVLLIGGVVAALAMTGVLGGNKNNGGSGNNSGGGEEVVEKEDNVVVSGDEKRFGAAEHGYVTVPSSWTRIGDAASNEQGFSDEKDENVVKITSYTKTGSTTVDKVASVEYNSAVASGVDVAIEEKEIGGRATKVIHSTNEEKTVWKYVFVFSEDDRIYVISLTVVKEDSELIESVPASWSLDLEF